MKNGNANRTATQAFGIFVFAVLALSNFSFAATLPVDGGGGGSASYWTDWKNRDSPSGTGDYEDKVNFPDVCANPLGIECQTLAGVDYRQTGQTVTCTPSYGFSCINSQNNNSCLDYKVRFQCASTTPANRAPTISGIGGPSSIKVNEQGTWSITATDPEGGYLTYSVVWGDESSGGTASSAKSLSVGQTATFTHIYYTAGSYTPKFTVTDSGGLKAETSMSVNVQQAVPADTTPPTVSSSASVDTSNIGLATISISASDASGISEIKIYTAQGYPQGHGAYVLAKTCSKVTSCTYTSGYSAGTYTYYATAKDGSANGNSGSSSEKTFTITSPQPTNRAPVISKLGAPTSLKAGETGTWSVTASDPENGQLTYSVVWGDEGSGGTTAAKTASVGQTATFTHIYYSSGTYTPKFTVSDDKGATAQTSASVNVGSAPQPACTSPVCSSGQRRHQIGRDNNSCYIYTCVATQSVCVPGSLSPVGSAGETIPASKACLYNANSNTDGSVSFSVPGARAEPLPSAYFPIYVAKAGKYSLQLTVKGFSGESDSFQVTLYGPDGMPMKFGGYTKKTGEYYLSEDADVRFDFATLVSGASPYNQFATIWADHEMVYEGEPRPVMSVQVVQWEINTPGTYTLRVFHRENSATLLDVKLLESTGTPQPTNKAPIISGSSGPSSLPVGETGTWKISAYDPENGYLSYSVVWGDEGSNKQPESRRTLSANQAATFTHVYYSAGTYTITMTVTDDQEQSAQSTITVNVGSGKYSVDVGAYVEPSQVKLYESYKVTGQIKYNSGPSDSAQQFKVVTSSTPIGSQGLAKADAKSLGKGEAKLLKAASKQIRLEASEDLWQAFIDYFTKTQKAPAPSITPSTTESGGSGGSGTSVAGVTGTTATDSQERVDYITLKPGESTTVSAYFRASRPGTKVVRVKVYAYNDKIVCGQSIQAPCDRYGLVGEASTKVEVLKKETPPSPPSEGTIKLYKGWNQISVPVGATVSMKEISAECNSKPYAWQLSSTGYSKAYTLYPGVGYWIKSNGECEYDVAESGADQPFANPELFAGWNLVGAPESTVSISDYAGSCSISQGPWYYSHETGKPKPDYVYSSTLEPGRAYWVNVPASCTLGGEEQPPVPPQTQATQQPSASSGGGSDSNQTQRR